MQESIKITGRLIKAARALAGVSRSDFAAATGMRVETLKAMERSGSARIEAGPDADAVSRGFEIFGVIVIEEAAGLGVGVRLKFTRQDVRQIARLEDEGGIVGSDDAP